MNSSRLTRVALLLGLVLLLALAAGVSAQGGTMPHRAGHEAGVDELARDDDDYVVSFATSGSASVTCFGPADYTPGDALLLENHGPFAPCWIKWFDATTSGLTGSANINALHDECGPGDPGCEIYLSFQGATSVPGVGTAKAQDVVGAAYTGPAFDEYDYWWMVFDGSDVGLRASSEKIDGLYIFDPGEEPAELGCWPLMLISTAGDYTVPDMWGNDLSGGGEDVLGFCAYWLGWDTAGYWFKYHDGDAEGAPANSIIGLSHEDGRLAFARFEFLTKGPFHVDGANGDHSEVYHFFQGEYDGPTYSFPDQAWTTDKADSFTVYHSD